MSTAGEPGGRLDRARASARRARETAARRGEEARLRSPAVAVAAAAFERERLGAAGLLAGGLAYRLFFWLVAFGVVAAALLSLVLGGERQSLETVAREYGMGLAAARAAAEAIDSGAHSRLYFLAAGLPLTIWFGAGVVRAVSLAHALAWGLRPGRLRRPYVAGAAFTVLLAALVAVTQLAEAANARLPGPACCCSSLSPACTSRR